jgi:Meiotically Up-regulated Gene 113 (MUG113) protein
MPSWSIPNSPAWAAKRVRKHSHHSAGSRSRGRLARLAVGAERRTLPMDLPPMAIGSVYILQTTDERYVKIGFSTRIALRFSEIASTTFAADHGGIALIGFFPGSHETEALLHQRFAGYRAHGDWYDRAILEHFTGPIFPAIGNLSRVQKTSLQVIQMGNPAAALALQRFHKLTPERRHEIAKRGQKSGSCALGE